MEVVCDTGPHCNYLVGLLLWKLAEFSFVVSVVRWKELLELLLEVLAVTPIAATGAAIFSAAHLSQLD